MSIFGSVTHFIGSAASTAGKPFGSAVHAVNKVTGKISHSIAKVPVIGTPVNAIVNMSTTGPLQFTDSVLKGKRIDKAGLQLVKDHVSDVKTLAPYAQGVVSLVPGVGSGVSGIIGAGAALASGRPINDAIQEGIADSIPGGPLAKTAFNISADAIQGKPFNVARIQIPGVDPVILKNTLALTSQLASGKPVSKAVEDAAIANLPPNVQTAIKIADGQGVNSTAAIINASLGALPPDLRKAVSTGLSVGHARQLQGQAVQMLNLGASKLADEGSKVASSNPIISAARKNFAGKHGFDIGTGLMQKTGVTPLMISHIRESLATAEKIGFDGALATHIGAVTSAKPKTSDSQHIASYFATHGMKSGSPEQKDVLIREVAKSPSGKNGALHALHESKPSWWHKLLVSVGIYDK